MQRVLDPDRSARCRYTCLAVPLLFALATELEQARPPIARVAAKHTTRDSTKYARCARSFRQHHGQRISHAVVMTDALNVHEGTLKLKKLALQRRAA